MRIGFLGYATWLTFLLVPKMQNLKMTVIDFPMSYIYGFVAFGFVMMTFRSVQVAIAALAAGLERARAARRRRGVTGGDA